jgi:hypothetical protein
MIADEEKRLRRAIGRWVLACGAPAGALVACTSGAATTGAASDAGAESAGPRDATATADVATDCHPSAPYFLDASYVIVGDANCFYFVDFPCGSSYQGPDDADCYLSGKDCVSACTLDGAAVFDCQYWPGSGCFNGVVDAQPGRPTKVACSVCAGVGRRPAGLSRAPCVLAAGVLGEYLAQAAYLEAASVHAFERLGRELAAHGAPRELVEAAGRSARDEVRHARVVGRLARAQGARPPSVCLSAARVRPLSRVALENATEGCVRETFGALVATWQAMYAAHPGLRRTMRRIADDEIRHAALARSAARWMDGRLGARVRARVEQARRVEVAALRREVADPVDPVLAREAGLPDAATACRLLDHAMGYALERP